MADNNTKELFERLAEPFLPQDLEWRVGQSVGNETEGFRGLALTYINARAVMQRLDDVFGPENWKDEYEAGPQGGVKCGLSLRVNNEWLTKWDGADNTDVEAVKGGLSDALKRAAVKWGIGRYLYEFPAVWCRCTKRGKTTILLERPAIPEWAYPKSYVGEKETGKIPINAYADVTPTAVGGNKNGNGTKPATESKPAPATTAPKPVAPAAPSKPEATQAPTAPAAANNEGSEAVRRAKAYKVPASVPMAGRTLGEAMEDPKLGVSILQFLAGRVANRANKKFEPANDEQKKLAAAAGFLLDQVAAPVAA